MPMSSNLTEIRKIKPLNDGEHAPITLAEVFLCQRIPSLIRTWKYDRGFVPAYRVTKAMAVDYWSRKPYNTVFPCFYESKRSYFLLRK
jgi:hypothetical protein